MASGPKEMIFPYAKEASKECKWEEEGVRDHIGLHKFKEYRSDRYLPYFLKPFKKTEQQDSGQYFRIHWTHSPG